MNNEKRRHVLGAFTGLAIGAMAPGLTHAQGAMKRVGVFGRGGGNDIFDYWRERLPKEFEALGFVEGRNLQFLWFDVTPRINTSEGQSAGLRAAALSTAAEVGRARVDCALVNGEPGTQMLKDAAPNTPIVTMVADPIASGFAKSLARPGGNITGVHWGARDVALKTTELSKRIIPGMTCMGFAATEPVLRFGGSSALEAATGALNLRLKTVVVKDTDVADPARLRREFAALRREGCLAAQFAVPTDALGEVVRKAAVENHIALVGSALEEEGFLLGYSAEREGQQPSIKRMTAMVARILRGEKPADIPFEGPSSYRLSINMKTAERLGLTVPPDIALMAQDIAR